nr:exo-alpha-sialidase [Actinopolyspora erythraea]
MSSSVLLMIGTRKGLWLARRNGDGGGWQLAGPQLPMTEVYAVAVDTRGAPRLLAGTESPHFGPTLVTSDDLGNSWQEPDHAPIAFPADTGTALRRVWQIVPGPVSEPEVIYAGAQPSALFRSEDGGSNYELVRGLWDHPHRAEWFPGAGGQAVHTILPDPREPSRVLVGMSTGGVYRTVDGGSEWRPANSGIRAYFMPEDDYPEFGQCVHKMARNTSSPDRIYLQNHHGVYRSDDGADTWESIAEGLPADFGFPVGVDPVDPDTVYTFPLVADAHRFPPEGSCRIYRSRDAGRSWEGLGEGLPREGFWSAVMRDALCLDDADPAGVYFGSRSGEVYASSDRGESWTLVAEHLPDVLSLRAAVV